MKKFERYKCKEYISDTTLMKLNVYCIDSELSGVTYATDYDRFLIIRGNEFAVCKLKDLPEAMKECIPRARKEIVEILEDLKDLKRMGVFLKGE